MNKRIRNKYQAVYNDLYQTKQPITNDACRKMINMFSLKTIKGPINTMHLDERNDINQFLRNHESGGKYHAEDSNQNNPNNKNYRFNKKRPTKRFRYPK